MNLQLINIENIKRFLKFYLKDYQEEDYEFTYSYDKDTNEITFLLNRWDEYCYFLFSLSGIKINGITEEDLSFAWQSYLCYLFGNRYKDYYRHIVKTKHDDIKIIYAKDGIPIGYPLEEAINKIYKFIIKEELKDLEEEFIILEKEGKVWEGLPRKTLVKRRKR